MDRRPWTEQEDLIISKLVNKYGTKKWPLISERLGSETKFSRTGKQCRQRWYNHLNPEINNLQWSQGDEELLFRAHREHGNKWKNISKLFEGRTDNSIKNHFYSTIRRSLRRINKMQGEKNSTIKMRSIKPHVLSKILQDIHLTELIFKIGKQKPSKHSTHNDILTNQGYHFMIQKLGEINHQYQIQKKIKQGRKKNSKNTLLENQNALSLEKKEEVFQIQLIKKEKSQKKQKLGVQMEIQQQKVSKRIKKISKIKRIRRIIHKKVKQQKQSDNSERQSKFNLKMDDSPNKRSRKKINYLQLNEGIAQQNNKNGWIEMDHQRFEQTVMEQTGFESNCFRKMEQKTQSTKFDKFERNQHNRQFNNEYSQSYIKMFEEDCNELEEIKEEEELRLSQRESFCTHNIFLNCHQNKPINFQLSQPSPSFAKRDHLNHLNENLIVIGTSYSKLMNWNQSSQSKDESLGSECNLLANSERKRSEEEYLEEILEINFDPEFALRSQEDQENCLDQMTEQHRQIKQ